MSSELTLMAAAAVAVWFVVIAFVGDVTKDASQRLFFPNPSDFSAKFVRP